MSYCASCKNKTQDQPKSKETYTAKNNAKMMRSVCNTCGKKKNTILPATYKEAADPKRGGSFLAAGYGVKRT